MQRDDITGFGDGGKALGNFFGFVLVFDFYFHGNLILDFGLFFIAF